MYFLELLIVMENTSQIVLVDTSQIVLVDNISNIGDNTMIADPSPEDGGSENVVDPT
jgi:hypothetical protein